VTPTAAAELLIRSSVAIVLAQNQGFQVPAKIYESVGFRVPTLVVTEAGSAAAREAHRIGAWAVSAGDVAGIAKIFSRLWEGSAPSRQEPCEPVDYPTLAQSMAETLARFAASVS